ncbi:MAG: patatin-like phospholipase family protein [Candidatus Dormibacteraeota bacterium]|nr:patatin-like phospholipase family protein [Candidatus Dormibacteraeota bacterium]
MRTRPGRRSGTAFVLGGGGLLGAAEVGMLRALFEAGITPDLVVGTSIGALNGAAVAAEPSITGVEHLTELWRALTASGVFSGSVFRRVGTLARTRTALHSNVPLRRMLEQHLPVARFDDLPVHFECVAASVERAAEHWFSEGPLVDAVLASAAVPGILPAMRIGEEHFIDGGIVNSIPVSRAVRLNASTIYVMHVGRIDRPLRVARQPFEVGLVAFEIARRHRFHADMATLPPDVEVHVLPTGDREPPRYDSLASLRYRDVSQVMERADAAYTATAAYLAARVP